MNLLVTLKARKISFFSPVFQTVAARI